MRKESLTGHGSHSVILINRREHELCLKMSSPHARDPSSGSLSDEVSQLIRLWERIERALWGMVPMDYKEFEISELPESWTPDQ